MTAKEWELTDEDVFYIGMDVTKGGGDIADIYEVIRTSEKAAQKKLAEWIIGGSWQSARGGSLVRCIPEPRWQLLCKELGIE